jgi:hypothetical protein
MSVIASNKPDGAAIGSGSFGSQVESIQFIGNSFVKCEGSSNARAIRARSLWIVSASLSVVTNDAPLFGTSPVSYGSVELIIGYRQPTPAEIEPLGSINGKFLHVGNISVSDARLGLFRFCVKRTGFSHYFDESSAPIQSVILSTHGEGPYSFPASIGNVSRDLISSDGRISSRLDTNYSFIDVLSFPPDPTSCYFTDSRFPISREGKKLITTPGAVLSAFWGASMGRGSSDRFSDVTILSLSSMAPTSCFPGSTVLRHTAFDVSVKHL